MPEVGGIGGGGLPPQSGNATGEGATPARPISGADGAAGAVNTPVGQPGALGQPTGMPVPVSTPQPPVLPDVLAGREQSQMVAAERMRAAGGASATEQLLGLNQQPSIMGAIAAPPGNSEALRHMTPTMRRTIMRTLLSKQRAQMRRLARLTRREANEEREDKKGNSERGGFVEELLDQITPLDEALRARARDELNSSARMLDLLDELLVMQDYTFSQMGTFSQG